MPVPRCGASQTRSSSPLLLLTLLSGTSAVLRVRVPRMNAGGATIGAATRFSILSGRVLTPGSSGDGWWDGRCAAMPIVLPPSASRSKWQCFYYGRSDDKWNCGLPAFLPTGVSGLAESDDGLTWTRVEGPLEGGAILRPSDAPDAFDHVHLGMTDVFPLAGGAYAALYFGGSADEVRLGMGPSPPIRGFKMRPGAATSRDGRGRVWERAHGSNPLLDVGTSGTWDSNFVSWPRALPLDPGQPDGEWLMTYHALQPPEAEGAPPRWAVGAAVSQDGHPIGRYAKLEGPILSGGAPGSFDEAGIGTRHVVHDPAGAVSGAGLVMVYEGVGADGRHRLGIATSSDGRLWTKAEGLGPDPGGPIFEGAPPEADAWDNGNVGTLASTRSSPLGAWSAACKCSPRRPLLPTGTLASTRSAMPGACTCSSRRPRPSPQVRRGSSHCRAACTCSPRRPLPSPHRYAVGRPTAERPLAPVLRRHVEQGTHRRHRGRGGGCAHHGALGARARLGQRSVRGRARRRRRDFPHPWSLASCMHVLTTAPPPHRAGETSLILAAERGDAGTLRILLAAGADPGASSRSGWTALHGAAEHGSVPIIEMLAAAGGDVSALAKSGKTPLDIARQYARPEAAQALEALGAAAKVSGDTPSTF